jgi:hypothetical protein
MTHGEISIQKNNTKTNVCRLETGYYNEGPTK